MATYAAGLNDPGSALLGLRATVLALGVGLLACMPLALFAAEVAVPESLSGACPAGQALPVALQLRPTRAMSETTSSAKGWQFLPIFIEGKHGSLIRTRYTFNTDRTAPNQWLTLKIHFDQVTSQPSLAYVYPIDGTKFSGDRQRIYFRLLPDQINEAQLSLQTPRQGGGLAIVTCQRGRASIYSVNLPGRMLTPAKPSGSLEVDASGQPILRMPLGR